MDRRLFCGLAALCLALPALTSTPTPAAGADEVVFIGREIDLLKPFQCGTDIRKAGRYGLEVSWNEEGARSKLKVFRGEDDLCEVQGETLTGVNVPASRVRIITKVNADKKAIEIDVIMPTGVRDRIANQVFYLPYTDRN